MRLRIIGAVVTVAVVLLVTPLTSAAQQPANVPRIGYLGGTVPSAFPHLQQAFLQGLREFGYIEGQNVAIEYRWAEGKAERFPDLAAELVRLKVDVILASGGTASALAAKQATTTTPVVFTLVANPVGSGLVPSLARPAGNITGMALLTPEVNEKRLELLKEAVPGVSRVAVLWNPGNESHEEQVKSLTVAARELRVQLQPVEVLRPDDLEGAFSGMGKAHAGALMVLVSPLHHRHLQVIADLAGKNRLPAMMEFVEFVEAGGLMAYGPSFTDIYRRAGTYVGRILKGTKPADLPVEQPRTFELVINLKTAKALGLTIPQSILIRADQVIQ